MRLTKKNLYGPESQKCVNSRAFTVLSLVCALLITALSNPVVAAVGPNWIEQFGITWTFDKNLTLDGVGDTYRYGQYANGDYWIKGPVNIVAINPPYSIVDSPYIDRSTGLTVSPYTIYNRSINGSMLNVIPGGPQGYDSSIASWDVSLCVNTDVRPDNPLTIDVSQIPIKSLVSTISTWDVSSKYGIPQLQTAAILTIVSFVPSTGSFRPPYCGDNKLMQDRFMGKTEEILSSTIDWSALAQLAPVDGTRSISDSENALKNHGYCTVQTGLTA